MSENRLWSNQWLLYSIIAVLAISLASVVSYRRDQPVTTVILVRHAEKNIEPDNPNPALTQAGQERAQTLARMLDKTGVTAVYATQYIRTQSTASPLADRLGLKVNQTDAKDVDGLVAKIKAEHRGGIIFVAGHNNSVPAIVAGLGGGNYPTIPENEYDNLFVVTIYRSGKAKTIKMKYGNPSPAASEGQSTIK